MSSQNKYSQLERDILRSCHLNEWHGSACFPAPARDSLNIPDGPTDELVKDTVIHLVRTGAIEVGRFDADNFIPELASESVVSDLVNNKDSEFFMRTRSDVYDEIKNEF